MHACWLAMIPNKYSAFVTIQQHCHTFAQTPTFGCTFSLGRLNSVDTCDSA
jgi:hypothetical protein